MKPKIAPRLRANVEKKILELLCVEYAIRPESLDTTFADLGFSEFDRIVFLTMISTDMHVRQLDDDEIDRTLTLRDVVELVCLRRAAQIRVKTECGHRIRTTP